MNRLHLFLAFLLVSPVACAASNMAAPVTGAPLTGAAPAPVASAARLSRDVMPLGYTLELDVLPELDRFSGRVQIAVRSAQETARVRLHGLGLEVYEVYAEVDGEHVPGTFAQLTNDGLAELTFERPLPEGRSVLSLRYRAQFDSTLSGLYSVQQGEDAYAFSQFEPYSARKAFPCFDEPSFKTPFDLWLTVRAEHAAIGNAPQIGEELIAGGYKRVQFKTTQPLPTYLVALAVGPLDVVEGPPIAPTPLRPQPIPFRGVAPRGQGAKLAYALRETPAMVEALERYFGIAYPYDKLDIIAVPDFAAGAMENAGAITFRDYLLLLDGDRAPESQRRAFAYVTAHELAHQWFGNLVTMAWWDDLWLNEAFATWMGHAIVDQLWPAQQAHLSLLASAQHAMDEDSLLSARMIRQPIVTTHDISGAFDAITYSKGGAVLTMFEHFVGPEVFRRGVSRYLKANAWGNATAEDLLSALSAEAGRDLGPAFESFLNQAGVPLVQVEPHCEAGQGSLSLSQSRYLPAGSTGDRARQWQLPMCVAYGASGARKTVCEMLATQHATWPLDGCPEWVMPNAGAAGYFVWSLPPEALSALRERGWPNLSVREQVSVGHTLSAGFDSADLGASEVLAALPQLSSSPARAVAHAPMGIMAFVHEHVAEQSLRPQVEAYARELYAPALRRLGYMTNDKEDGEIRLLRADVLSFLSRIGKDRAVRRRLAVIGERHLRKAQKPASGVSTELLGLAMRVAMEDARSLGLYDAALARFKATTDPIDRARLLSALASARGPLGLRSEALCLDPDLRVNEILTVLATQLSQEDTREAAYVFMTSHYDDLSVRLSTRQLAQLPGLTTGFCSGEHAARLQAFFADKVDGLAGGPRALSEALEQLRLCEARAVAQRASTAVFFKR